MARRRGLRFARCAEFVVYWLCRDVVHAPWRIVRQPKRREGMRPVGLLANFSGDVRRAYETTGDLIPCA